VSTALQTVMEQESSLLIPTYERFPVLFERGEGVYLYDSEGKKYLDFLSGIGVNALGHGHPAIQKTIATQAAQLIHVSNLFFHPYQAKLASELTELSGLERAFFCNSGTEAWEGALKLARAYSRQRNGDNTLRTTFLVMENSFHGRTFGSLATTGQKKYQDPFAPLVPGVRFVRYNDVHDLAAHFDETVCAVGMETIQGEGGIQSVSAEFLGAARTLCDKYGALLMLDEIQCGLGRTGTYYAFQGYDVKPDVVTLAKPLAAGLPLGAILASEDVAQAFHPGMHGTTFGGGPLACAVALTFLNVLKEEGILAHVSETGAYFEEQLNALKAKHDCIVCVRGKGLMLAAELNSGDVAKEAVKQMLSRGVIINRTHDTVLRFLPPYIVTKTHVDEVVEKLDATLSACAGAAQAMPTCAG
jgi:acetylornithine/N-succinyldiaminopimelate aminotransferase